METYFNTESIQTAIHVSLYLKVVVWLPISVLEEKNVDIVDYYLRRRYFTDNYPFIFVDCYYHCFSQFYS